MTPEEIAREKAKEAYEEALEAYEEAKEAALEAFIIRLKEIEKERRKA